jgi:hypothetical protein
MWSVKTKDWAAGRRWAKRNAVACPGVIYSIRQDGRELSYRYEDGLIYCTGNGKQVKPYRPGFHHLRKKSVEKAT